MTELGEDSELAYMTDDELLEEWALSIKAKYTAIGRLRREIAYEQYVLAEANRRTLKWAR